MTSHLLKTSFLVLSLVACGVAPETTVSNGNGQVAATKNSLITKVKPLQGWRADALVAAFAAIDLTTLDASTQAAAFGTDALFAAVDVSNPLATIKSSVIVPAGTQDQLKDPNMSKVFYVEFTDEAGTAVNHGPFELHSQEGGPCGGFAVNALTCAANLRCEAHAGMQDEPGTCVTN